MNCPQEERELLAVVDIGSNSVRMNIYEIDEKSGAFSVAMSSRAMLKLISYIDGGKLSADGEGKLFSLLREYLAKANSVPCDNFAAFATASLRSISNSDKVLGKIKARLGIDIEIISGQDEARFDFIATKEHFGARLAPRGVVVDMGGGSTEFIAYEKGEIKHICSLPIGSLGLWKSFCGARRDEPFPSATERENIADFVEHEIKKAAPLLDFGGTAYLIGGTARALSRIDATLENRSEAPDGYVMTNDRFAAVRSAAVADADGDMALIRRICPDRMTSIIPGAVAYEKIVSLLGVTRAVISLSGVREGYVTDYVRRNRRTAREF